MGMMGSVVLIFWAIGFLIGTGVVAFILLGRFCWGQVYSG